MLKVKGTDTALAVPFGTVAEMRCGFATAHRTRFGFEAGDKPLVIEAVTVEAIGEAADLSEDTVPTATRGEADIDTALTADFYSDGHWHSARYVRRDSMRPGDTLTGPAVLVEPHTSIVIEPG